MVLGKKVTVSAIAACLLIITPTSASTEDGRDASRCQQEGQALLPALQQLLTQVRSLPAVHRLNEQLRAGAIELRQAQDQSRGLRSEFERASRIFNEHAALLERSERMATQKGLWENPEVRQQYEQAVAQGTVVGQQLEDKERAVKHAEAATERLERKYGQALEKIEREEKLKQIKHLLEQAMTAVTTTPAEMMSKLEGISSLATELQLGLDFDPARSLAAQLSACLEVQEQAERDHVEQRRDAEKDANVRVVSHFLFAVALAACGIGIYRRWQRRTKEGASRY